MILVTLYQSFFLQMHSSHESTLLPLLPSLSLLDKSTFSTRMLSIALWKKSVKEEAACFCNSFHNFDQCFTKEHRETTKLFLFAPLARVDSLLNWLKKEWTDSFIPFLMLHGLLGLIILVHEAKKQFLKSMHINPRSKYCLFENIKTRMRLIRSW